MSDTQEVKIVTADPSGLGLFGLALITLVASSQKFGITTGTSILVPWAFFLGGIAQIIASLQDFKIKNLFGATAFGAYGLFWISMSFVWLIRLGALGPELAAAADVKQLGIVFIGYLFFSLYLTVTTLVLNKVLFLIIALIDVLFLSLALDSFGMGVIWQKVAAVSEISISLLGFYAGSAATVNGIIGKKIVPLGKPIMTFK